ncbi:hypothetical protein [Demequina sp.]|uniref:hypothetical protein n=1 Tax=Demequina sp. TaxID=2050685 RepID=UPI0025BB94A4|nr:hypothetical protein [Demequina sp.]
MDPKYYQVGPGFWGFLATFVMALAIIVIYWSLTKHLRKIRRDAEREQVEREQEAQRKKASGVQDRDGGGDVVAGESGDRE